MKRCILIAALLLFPVQLVAEEQEVEHVTYEAFLRAVEEGKVSKVHLGEFAGIEGQLETADGTRRFSTSHPLQAANDPLLLRLLEEKNVTIGPDAGSPFASETFGSWILDTETFAILILLTLLVISIVQLRILRRLRKNAAGSGLPPVQPDISALGGNPSVGLPRHPLDFAGKGKLFLKVLLSCGLPLFIIAVIHLSRLEGTGDPRMTDGSLSLAESRWTETLLFLSSIMLVFGCWLTAITAAVRRRSVGWVFAILFLWPLSAFYIYKE